MANESKLIVVQSGALSYEIDPDLAGRVTRMSFAGEELLVDATVHPDNWGATYWTSPQADWGWPPVPEVDRSPYHVVSLAKGVHCRSSPAQIGPRHFHVEKAFMPGPHLGSIDSRYTIVNRGDAPFYMANWEIARVHPGGVTFYPTGEREISPIAPHAELVTEKRYGCSFYDHREFALGLSRKLHADGEGGFLAHATPRHLILKIFCDTSAQEQAPGEGECEIFANFDGKYVEIEVQGAHVAIAPGARHDLLVRTVVVPLPSGLKLSNFQALVQLAEAEVARYAPPDLVGRWGRAR